MTLELPSATLDREQLRVLNARLVEQVDELKLSNRLAVAKAEQLALSLKYRSESLANASHDLRNPLTSLLILAGILKENSVRNLTAKQVEYANVIHAAGTDLLRLVNELLDLTDVEPGTATPVITELGLGDVEDYRQRAPTADVPIPPSPPRSAEAGVKALVVDDNAINIFALTALLKRAGVAVVSVDSGPAGIAVLEYVPDIDIALVDIMMPVMDGYETIRAMRKLPSRQDLPIIAVTAKTGDGELARCIDAGASTYISKPVHAAKLVGVMSEWLPAGKLTLN